MKQEAIIQCQNQSIIKEIFFSENLLDIEIKKNKYL